MSQEDYIISDQAGVAFLADLNAHLGAIATNNSGATEPTTKYAYMLWADTTTGLLKQRNAANTDWVTLGTMADATLGLLSRAGGNMTGAINEARSTVASATTPDIWTGTGNNINYTGTTTATGFAASPQAGASRVLDCASTAAFTAGANMLIDGYSSGQTLTVAAGDRISVFARTTTQFVLAKVNNLTTTAAEKLPTIGCTQSGGALTFSASAQYLDFRSTTLTSGTISTVLATPSNLVLPSGATLGTVTTVSARIVVVEINNAGTAELAIVNLAGGNDLSETGTINTTAIDTASDSDNVFYSTTARTGVAYRVVGVVDAVNTAGAWGNPTLVQGAGGQAVTVMSSFGFGATFVDVTGSRTIGGTYYNTYGKLIEVYISASHTAAWEGEMTIGGESFKAPYMSAVGTQMGYTWRIPAWKSYSYAGPSTLIAWKEFR